MIIIYDFDGTLTPYSMPQYPIIQGCGYDDVKLLADIKNEMNQGLDFYTAYYKCYTDILNRNNIPLTIENICQGAQDTKFNPGVLDFLSKFESFKTGIKHYIVSSGVKYYVEKTPLSALVDGIYGVTFSLGSNNVFQKIDYLLSGTEKANVIKQIQEQNGGANDVIYFGDGLTDKSAFEYIKSIGGTNVFIAQPGVSSAKTYSKLAHLIDKRFNPDFTVDSEVYNFMQSLANKEKTNVSRNPEVPLQINE